MARNALFAASSALVVFATSLLRADPPGEGRIDPEVLKTVKRATVYLRITLRDGDEVQGSGFFAVTPNLVLTNAHVLGMLRSESQKPAKIEVVVNSGERDERTLTARVLGVDSGSDLAALAVPGKDLPTPLKVVSKELNETDPVYIFGFPFGKDLGKNITVSKSSISSLRKTAAGTLEKIQVNGGMSPGNSGGPVTNEKGEVIGVAVSGIRSTTINFAVPARAVFFFITGSMKSWHTSVAFKDGDKVRVPFRMEMSDPLKGVGDVWLETWTGDPGKTRLGSQFKPDDKLPGDSPREKITLAYKDGVGTGELVFPADPPKGKVWWWQLVFISGNKSKSWSSAHAYRPPPPVERKPAVLKYKHQPGADSEWKLTNTTTLKIRDEDDVDHSLAMKMTADLKATTNGEIKDGIATTALTLSKVELALTLDGKPLGDSKEDQAIAKETPLFAATMQVNADGSLKQTAANLTKIPRLDQRQWKVVGDRLFATLQALSAPLPGKETAPASTYKITIPITIFSAGTAQNATADLTCEYAGIRTREKREEAVVLFKGPVRGTALKGMSVTGKVDGGMWIDLATGQIVNAYNTIDVDLDQTIGKNHIRMGGTIEANLKRALPVVSDPFKEKKP
jgi:S1-C subfamily serine protease